MFNKNISHLKCAICMNIPFAQIMVSLSADIGEACLSDEYCLFEDSKCENSICRCITGIYDKTSRKCDTSKLILRCNGNISL